VNPKKMLAAFLLFLLNAVLFGNQQKIIKDDLGFPYILTSPPQRIISLAPNITEILFDLDLGEKIVGVTRYCDFPEKALKKEKIGGLIDLNLERIIALKPDLIIGFRGNPIRTIERLRGLHLPLFVLEIGKNLETVFIIIEKIGTITQKEKKAEILVESLKKRYNKTQAALRNVQHEPRVFLSIHGTGLWTCGKGSFLNDLVEKARGVNIAGNIRRKWLHYNREQLIHDNPEVIIILSKSQREFSNVKDWIKNEAHLKGIKAVKTDRIYFLDENLATRPGPRLMDALEELARILHPQFFKEER
jgi:iron complex transport system substrate-binding protein